jgi:hypothetical protein
VIPILALTLQMGIFASSAAMAGTKGVKSLFLNGVDISSARNQSLQNVDVMINEAGDIFITAPQYQVNEEDTYIPLSKYSQGLGIPAHKSPEAIKGPGKKGDQSQNVAPKGDPAGPDEGGVSKPVATKTKTTAKTDSATSEETPSPNNSPASGPKDKDDGGKGAGAEDAADPSSPPSSDGQG